MEDSMSNLPAVLHSIEVLAAVGMVSHCRFPTGNM